MVPIHLGNNGLVICVDNYILHSQVAMRYWRFEVMQVGHRWRHVMNQRQLVIPGRFLASKIFTECVSSVVIESQSVSLWLYADPLYEPGHDDDAAEFQNVFVDEMLITCSIFCQFDSKCKEWIRRFQLSSVGRECHLLPRFPFLKSPPPKFQHVIWVQLPCSGNQGWSQSRGGNSESHVKYFLIWHVYFKQYKLSCISIKYYFNAERV